LCDFNDFKIIDVSFYIIANGKIAASIIAEAADKVRKL